MMIALGLLTLGTLALWSLAAWGLYQLMRLDAGWVGGVQAWAEALPIGVWLDRWAPGWQSMLRLALDLMQTVLAGVAEAAPWLVWLVWGAGTALVLAVAALLALVVRLMRPAPPVTAVAVRP